MDRMDSDNEDNSGSENEEVYERPLRINLPFHFRPEELQEYRVIAGNDQDQGDMEAQSNEDNAATDHQSVQDQQQYDLSRSSRHEYLGDTEEVSGRNVVPDEDMVSLPILTPSAAHNLILLPSQTLPLTIFCPIQQSMLRNVIAKDKTIGIIHTRVASTGQGRFEEYGTTAEIYEYQQEVGGPSLSVKAKGRQRFKVIDSHRETTGCIVARVRILPEIRMPDPLHYVRLFSQLRRNAPKVCTEAGQNLQVRDVGCVRSRTSWAARREAALLTPWPSWVYDLYDDEQLAIKLVNLIVTQFNMRIEEKLQIPRDPQELSYWAAVNLPLTDTQRLSLLAINTPTQRLRFILYVVKNSGKGLFCRCGRLIANTSDIICMSTDGPQGTFVNPDGYIHEMITVTKINSGLLSGDASTRHSWFPGYAWRILSCRNCTSHIGWMFTAEKQLKPKTFYGITRASVRTRFTHADEEETNPLHYVI